MKNFSTLLGILLLFLIGATTISYAKSAGEITGIWMARGYGRVLEVDSKEVHIYDLTSISCTASVVYPIAMFVNGMSVFNDVLTFKRGVTQYTFDKIPMLPKLCLQKLSKKERKSPIYNFDVLWNTFNEQYAYFKERNIDWYQLRDKYRNRVNEKTSQAELFVICDTLLKECNDGHVSISASDKIMEKAAIIGDWDTRPRPDLKGLREAIIAKYIIDPNRHNISRTVWGKVNDSIGYIQVNSMGAQGDFGIPDNKIPENGQDLYLKYLARNPDTFKDDIDGMNATMKKVLNDLGDTGKIILDLRFNGGGEDMVGLAVLSYLVGTEKTIFTKKNRVGDSFSEAYPFTLSPQDETYSGKLYLLQSHYSASATEVLLLASLAYENIFRIGSPSEGAFSDILEKRLPNGWQFSLSNEVYQDRNGISYEAKGIPVHIDLNYPKDEYKFVAQLKSELELIGDKAIETILEDADRLIISPKPSYNQPEEQKY